MSGPIARTIGDGTQAVAEEYGLALLGLWSFLLLCAGLAQIGRVGESLVAREVVAAAGGDVETGLGRPRGMPGEAPDQVHQRLVDPDHIAARLTPKSARGPVEVKPLWITRPHV